MLAQATGAGSPGVNNFMVALTFGNDTLPIITLDPMHLFRGGFHQFLLVLRNHQVANTNGQTEAGGNLKTNIFCPVQEPGCFFVTKTVVNFLNHPAQNLAVHQIIMIFHAAG